MLPVSVLDVLTYLGPESSYTEEDVEMILKAETVAQANICRIPTITEETPFPEDLSLALKRRVIRSLSMRQNHLGYQSTVTEFGAINTRVGHDLEIARLERPYRKVTIG